MFPLDPKTLDRIARVICDIDGPFQRSVSQLQELLENAHWSDPPIYDGSPRIPWFTDALSERADDDIAMERLLCRVCDPIEYDDGMESAELVRQEVNKALSPERLAVSYVGGRPVLGELARNDGSPVFTEPTELDSRLRRLIRDSRAVDLLMARVDETRICETHGAYVFAVIGIGSFVEGLLYSVLTERDKVLLDKGFGHNGRWVPAQKAGLSLLIDTAHQKNWIQLDAKDFMHKVRDYRNFVHPRLQLERGADFDRDTVMLCWGPVRAILNDLEENLTPYT